MIEEQAVECGFEVRGVSNIMKTLLTCKVMLRYVFVRDCPSLILDILMSLFVILTFNFVVLCYFNSFFKN